MAKVCYVPKTFSPAHQDIIRAANAIIHEFSAQGYDLTLRQLYYQFVSRDLIANKQTEYKRLGSIVNDARLAGKIDWDAITDRTRNLQALSHWARPQEILDAIAEQYREEKWRLQPVRIEVWIEKDALAGVFQRVCRTLDVSYFSCRGYTSQSEMWAAAQRLRGYERGSMETGGPKNPQETVILHFGDHDPSGIDMSRDIQERLTLFGSNVEVRRLALTMEQIEEYTPPPNPAKETDARFAGYLAEYGDESWELDALRPDVLATLVRDAVLELRDEAAWETAETQERRRKRSLRAISQNYDDVTARLSDEIEMLEMEDGDDPEDDDAEDES
jgi:hypothetical protein